MTRALAGLLIAITCFGCEAARSAAEPRPPARRVIVPGVGRLPAFAHATVTGELIFVSGALGTRPESVTMVAGGVGPETTQALRNIEQILAAEGATRRHLAQCTVYLADMADYAAMNEAWIPFFAGDPPARATVAVAGLALGAALEVSCVAERPR